MTPPPIEKPDDEVLSRFAWTQREIDLLHEMVRDYDRARWLRGQLKWWGVWLLGVPTAGVTVYKAIEQAVLTIKGWR